VGGGEMGWLWPGDTGKVQRSKVSPEIWFLKAFRKYTYLEV